MQDPTAPLLEVEEDPFLKRQKELLKQFELSKNNLNQSNNNNVDIKRETIVKDVKKEPFSVNVESQKDYYLFLQKKKEIESEDEKMARMLQEQLENEKYEPPRMGNDDEMFARLLHEEEMAQIKEQEELRKKMLKDEEIARRVYEEEMVRVKQEELKRKQREDEELAKRLLLQEREEQERLKNLTQKDSDIARELYEEELRKKKEEDERLNWEKTMNIIKNEVRTDYDSEMARILREKEELENRLNNMNINNNIDYDMILPEYWQYINHDHQTFNITKNTTEWNKVQQAFNRSLGNRIIKIERLQNKVLWSFYNLKKAVMDNNLGSNETYLFHGSKTNAYDTIIKDGFDHRVANMNGALGAGIYFAKEASTSHTYVNSHTKKNVLLSCALRNKRCWHARHSKTSKQKRIK